MALILSMYYCIIAIDPQNTVYSETGESLRVSTDKFPMCFLTDKENDENEPPSPFIPLFCSRPNFLDLLARKRLLHLPLSVLVFSSLGKILIKVKR